MGREVLVYSVVGAVGLSAAAWGLLYLGKKIVNRYTAQVLTLIFNTASMIHDTCGTVPS